MADGLKTKEIVDYPRLVYWATIGPRTPLYHLMAAPFVIFIERSVDAILIINALFLIILGGATYKIGEVVFDWKAGVLATLIVITYPLIVDLSKVARPHAILPALSAVAILAIIYAIKSESLKYIWIVTFTALFAFFVHGFSLYLLIGPLSLYFVHGVFFRTKPRVPPNLREFPAWLRQKLRSPYVARGLIPATVLGMTIVISWIYVKWEQFHSLREVAQNIFSPMFDTWYYETTLPDVLSPFLFLVFLIGTATIILSALRSWAGNWLAVFVVASLLMMFFGAHLAFGGKSWHSLSGTMPLFAVVTAVGMYLLLGHIISGCNKSYKKYVSLFPVLMLIAVGLNYAIVGWGKPDNKRLHEWLGVRQDCLRTPGFCANPPVTGNWAIRDIIGLILDDYDCRTSGCEISLISHRPRYYSDEVFNYSQIEYYPDQSYRETTEFYPQRLLNFQRLGRGGGKFANWVVADYSILLTDANTERGEQAISNIERAIVSYLQYAHDNKNSAFKKIFEATLPNQETVILTKRVQDIDGNTLRAIVASLSISERVKEAMLYDLSEAGGDR